MPRQIGEMPVTRDAAALAGVGIFTRLNSHCNPLRLVITDRDRTEGRPSVDNRTPHA